MKTLLAQYDGLFESPPSARTAPVSRDSINAISFRCPHCGDMNLFFAGCDGLSRMFTLSDNSLFKSFQRQHSLRICEHEYCGGIVYVIKDVIENGNLWTYPFEKIDFDTTNVPEKLISVLREATSCFASGCYRASIIMVRRLLEEICSEKNASGNTLHEKLESLRNIAGLREDVFSLMMELKIIGNDAAHVKAKAYMNIGKEECAISIDISKDILKSIYQAETLLTRLQALKLQHDTDADDTHVERDT